jgi:coiled-coil domain-containing protein 55
MRDNKKFGLILKPKEQKIVKNKNSIYAEESDSDEEHLNSKNKVQDIRRNVNKNIIENASNHFLNDDEQITKNLINDPNVYDYDTLYDNMKEEKLNKYSLKKKEAQANKDQPKYLGAILAASERRKKEQVMIEDRLEKKRREREGVDLREDSKFVTKGYEEQMKLNIQKELQYQMEEKYNEKNTINGEYGLMGFYSNLMNKSQALGEGKKSKNEEEADRMLKMYMSKKEEYEKRIEKDKEEKDYRLRDVNKKEQSGKTEEKKSCLEEDLIKLKEQHDSKFVKKEEHFEKTMTEEEKKEVYKKRYLERKRQRTDN